MMKFLFALMLAFVLAACGRKPETPEEAMKAQLDNPIAMYDDKSIFHLALNPRPDDDKTDVENAKKYVAAKPAQFIELAVLEVYNVAMQRRGDLPNPTPQKQREIDGQNRWGAKSVAWLVANKAGHEAAIKAAVLRIKDRHFTSDMEKSLGMQLR